MPTSRQEATKICDIMTDYLSLSDAQEVTERLYMEVGRDSDNDSLKVSLAMLRDLFQEEGTGHA
jgi:hypothetical protein